MGRRKIEDRNTRKLVRAGASLTVSIPTEIIRKLKWREKQRVVVKRRGKGVTIVDWPDKAKKKLA